MNSFGAGRVGWELFFGLLLSSFSCATLSWTAQWIHRRWLPKSMCYEFHLCGMKNFSDLNCFFCCFLVEVVGSNWSCHASRNVSMKSIIIIMVAGSVVGNVLYALAGLMHSQLAILASRTMIGSWDQLEICNNIEAQKKSQKQKKYYFLQK